MSSSGHDNYWSHIAGFKLARRHAFEGVAALSSIAVLGLVGCGSNKSSNSSGSSGTAATTLATAAASAPARTTTPAGARTATPAAAALVAPTANSALKTGGTVNLAFVVPSVPLDPFANTTYTSQDLVGFVYSRLFRFASSREPATTLSRIPVPDLVESYQIPDPTTFVMKFRPNAMFTAPLNRALNAQDVLASYQYFTSQPKNTNAQVFAPIIDSLTAPSSDTVQFKLKTPYAPFLNKLANPQYLWMMSADAATGKVDPSQQLVGTGPWTFSGQNPTSFSYKKNPDYFLKGLPYADGVVENVIPSTATQEAQFTSGAIDLLAVPAADVASITKSVPKAVQTSYVGNLLGFMFFSDVTQDPLFKDARIRQAASVAIDRDGFLQLIYNGQGAWDNLINPGLGQWWLDPQGGKAGSSAQYFKHDPQMAKQLLSAAGYAGQSVTYYYPNNAYGDLFNQAADAVRGMLSDAGFKLNVVTVDYLSNWIEPSHGYWTQGLPASSIGFALQTPFTDPDDYLSSMLVQGGSRNNSKVNDPALETLVKQQQQELDTNKRLQEVDDIQVQQANQMYYVPQCNGKTFFLVQPWAQNAFWADDYAFGTEQIAYLSVNNK